MGTHSLRPTGSRRHMGSLRHMGTVGAPVPRWVAVAGWAALLLPLPSVLWRLAMLSGIDMGFRDADLYRDSAEAAIYVLGLDTVQVLVAMLCFGLIRPWSETLPHWIPALGGGRIHRLIPAAVGAIGAIALWSILLSLAAAFTRTWIGTTTGWTPDLGMSGGERALLLVAYIPFFLWPIAVSAVVAGYWVRRSPRRTQLTGTTRTTGSARPPSSAPA